MATELAAKVLQTIQNNAPERTASILLMERIPYIFREDWNAFRKWRSALAVCLSVDPCDIYLTGSAAVGVSLNPFKSFREFGDTSDLDLAIISPHHFDEAWRFMKGARRRDLDEQTWQLIQDHKSKYIYFGCIACNKLLSFFPFGAEWLAAFDGLSKLSPANGREISARVYRDTASLRGYQASNLRSLKAKTL